MVKYTRSGGEALALSIRILQELILVTKKFLLDTTDGMIGI